MLQTQTTDDHDALIPIIDAGDLLPHRPAYQTVWRYTQSGYASTGLKLRTTKIGRSVFTTRRWCDEFQQAITTATDPRPVEELANKILETADALRLAGYEP